MFIAFFVISGFFIPKISHFILSICICSFNVTSSTFEDILIAYDFLKKTDNTFKVEDWVNDFQEIVENDYVNSNVIMKEEDISKSIQKEN